MNKKIISIDASRSIDSIQKTGVENVSDELIKNIINLKKHNIKYIFYTPEYISWLPKEKQKVLKWPFKFLWTQIRLSWEMLRNKPDIFFSPVHILPFFTPKNVFKLIHDIAFKKNPKIYSLKQRVLLNIDLYRAIKKCKKIFVPSNQVKHDILKYTDIEENKVIVIPHGYTRKNKEVEKKETKKQILFIGRIEEKKNILNLIKAFKIFNQMHPEYILILAGGIDRAYVDNNRDMFDTRNVELFGYISEEKKYQLLSESACLAYVSKEEGFGIPILEAFDFNLPVASSDIPVLKEVGGEACVYVNPDSVEEIAQAIFSVVGTSSFVISTKPFVIPLKNGIQSELNKKNQHQLDKFSWRVSSEKYLEEILK
ncbi:MAG: glycosyltransferase family 1 protein [Patescibacteria group bacterium]